MTGNDLFREIGNISEKYVTEAEETKRSIIHNVVFRRSLATAACLMVCVGLYFTTRTGRKEAAMDSAGSAPQYDDGVKEEHMAVGEQEVSVKPDGGFNLSDILDVFESGNEKAESTQDYYQESASVPQDSASENVESNITNEPEGIAGESYDAGEMVKRLLAYPNEYEDLLQTDAFIVEHGIVKSGMEQWNAFIDCIGKGEPALVEVVKFTEEGDAIIAGIQYNGEYYYILMDYSRDAWGNTDWLETEYRHLYLDTRDGRTKVLLSDWDAEEDEISKIFDENPEYFFELVQYVND